MLSILKRSLKFWLSLLALQVAYLVYAPSMFTWTSVFQVFKKSQQEQQEQQEQEQEQQLLNL